MNIESCYKIAYIMKAHGLKGEVTLTILPDCPELSDLETVFVQVKNQLVPYFIDTVSVKGTKAYLKFQDVNTPEAAQALTGCSLFLEKGSRPALPRGEFYGDEVVGFEVVESSIGMLGRISEIQESGLSRHLIVVNEGKEVMIPLNGPFIKGVNKSKKRITVQLPDGFLDL